MKGFIFLAYFPFRTVGQEYNLDDIFNNNLINGFIFLTYISYI